MEIVESIRMVLLASQRAAGPADRETLVSQFGEQDVFDTSQLAEKFEVLQFNAPFVVVKRKADGFLGSLTFQHSPRLYWGFAGHEQSRSETEEASGG